MLRKIFRKILDWLTDALSAARGYSFPANYIRRWKLDMLRGLYEPETTSLFKKIVKPGMAVIDIGAHIGYYTRIAADLAGTGGIIYAFEADPENFVLLQKNTSRLKNVRPYQLAITDKTGWVDFYHYDEKSGVGSTLPNVPLNFKKRKISVKAADLDSFFTQLGVSKIDLIKMDIEGGEYAAMQGMKKILSQNQSPALIAEFAPAWVQAAGNTPLKFLNFIESFGFQIFAITKNGLLKLSPVKNDADYAEFIPKSSDGTNFGEFVNLYCVKPRI